MNYQSHFMSLITIFFISISVSTFQFSYATNKGKSVTVNGVDLYYEIHGEGPPLLHIHGNGGNANSNPDQVRFLSQHYQIIVVESRGHGRSDLGNQDLSYPLMASDMVALLEALDIQKVALMGISDGAVIGLYVASMVPERISKLVLFGANLSVKPPALYPWLDHALKRWGENVKAQLKQTPNNEDALRAAQHYSLIANMQDIPTSMLEKITAPTLVMAGDRDGMTNAHTVSIFESISNAQLAILPGTTHFVHREDPTLFNQLVHRFLSTPFTRPDTRTSFD